MLPNIAALHPQVVHFAIALLFVGVALRLIHFTGKFQFTGAAAATLLILGTVASVVSVKSGDDAHGPSERIPGAAVLVTEHEEWGERARNVFILVAALEIAGLALSNRRYRRFALVGSAAFGLFGLVVLYEAAEHGGELVYSYAGGVGTRSGDPADVGRLLRAGLYHQSVQDRNAGRPEDAARLLLEMADRYPDDFNVQLLVAESTLHDLSDPEGALQWLRGLTIPDDRRQQYRYGMLTVDAYEAAGHVDSARIVVERMLIDRPASRALRDRLEALNRP